MVKAMLYNAGLQSMIVSLHRTLFNRVFKMYLDNIRHFLPVQT